MGTSHQAERDAQKADDKRRADISATQQAIEGIYSNPQREADINDLQSATQTYLTNDLNKQNATAQRQAKFALARNGETQGSVDADLRRDLGQTYLRGTLEATRRASAAGNSLRQTDQQAKLDLFGQAAAGLDMGTASRNAMESMRANAGIAKADALQSGLGDLFSTFADIRKNSLERQGQNQAEKYQYGGAVYSPNQYWSAATGGPR